MYPPWSKQKEIELSFLIHVDSSRRDSHFSVFVCQNWDEKWPSYDHGKRARQSVIWPILCQLMAILVKFFEIWTSNLFLPCIYINFNIQTKFKSIRSKLAILSQRNSKTHQKCHSPKSLLLHFSMNLSETFRINVNMDFAHINHGRFLI